MGCPASSNTPEIYMPAYEHTAITTLPDDGRNISRNVAHLNILVHDVINLLYYEYCRDKQKYFYEETDCVVVLGPASSSTSEIDMQAYEGTAITALPDGGKNISQNVAHLNILLHDLINLLYYEY